MQKQYARHIYDLKFCTKKIVNDMLGAWYLFAYLSNSNST